MSKWVVNLSWDEAPHLSAKDKQEMLAGYSPHERDARSKGLPQLGAGAIYPVPESDIVVRPFEIPEEWEIAYGMDVGWKKTAAIWGAYNKKEDTWYLYSEYYRGYAEPSVHADGIRARGTWINGVIDPASRGGSQKDGVSLLDEYMKLGLELSLANNSVEPGLLDVFQRVSTGRLKVFSTLQNWLAEYRIYRRDDKGKVVKDRDHLMDATRYLMMSGFNVMSVKPPEEEDEVGHIAINALGRSEICGY